MNHLLVRKIDGSTACWESRTAEDVLDPIRGILVGVMISIAGFWIPLALMLAR